MEYRGARTFRQFFERFRGKGRVSEDSQALHAMEPLEALNLEQFSDEELSDLSAGASASIAMVNLERLRRRGWSIEPWGSTAEIRGDRPPGESAGWVDHLYRLVNQEHERIIYVSEPYNLSASAYADLERIREAGYRVKIDPGRSLHFPLHAVTIWIEKVSEYPYSDISL